MAGEGWDNVIFRLGDGLAVRVPRRVEGARLILNEQRWLPGLADRLPLPVPTPVHAGTPGAGYPWAWSVVPWIDGTAIEHHAVPDWLTVAEQLGAFLAAMHQPATADAPRNPYRGVPLADRSERLAQSLDALRDVADRARVEARWAELVETPPRDGPPLWLHGDLHGLNLLAGDDGTLSGVIDFGDMTAGDRATDLSVAWIVLPADVRDRFRQTAGAHHPVDDDTWARARGWALCLGVAHLGGDDRIAPMGRRAVAAALEDRS